MAETPAALDATLVEASQRCYVDRPVICALVKHCGSLRAELLKQIRKGWGQSLFIPGLHVPCVDTLVWTDYGTCFEHTSVVERVQLVLRLRY